MKSIKRKKLESAGWVVGDAADFLELTQTKKLFNHCRQDNGRGNKSMKHPSKRLAEHG